MLVLGLVLCVFAVGFLCWLLFTLAVYALPCFLGLTSAIAAYHHGAGLVGAMLVALLIGGATLALGQWAFALVRVPLARASIALLFAVPAAIAGYHAALGLAHIGVPSQGWSQVVGVIAAIVTGGTAFARMAVFVPPAPHGGVAPATRQTVAAAGHS